MIKINLLGEELVSDSNAPLQVVIYAGCMLLTVFTLYFVQSSLSSDLDTLTVQKEELDLKLKRLQTITSEVKDLEKKREDLRQKIAVIAKLKKSKRGPVRVLDDLNISVPERAWLTEGKELNGDFRITGMALDNQTIALFMRDLEKSEYFPKVDLVETVRAQYKGSDVKKFTLSAKVSYAGKIALEAADKAEEQEKGSSKDKKPKKGGGKEKGDDKTASLTVLREAIG